jgi:hypothetical protein
MHSMREHSPITKHEDESLTKEPKTSQSHVGELTDLDDKKLKFKIDCWLMPLL